MYGTFVNFSHDEKKDNQNFSNEDDNRFNIPHLTKHLSPTEFSSCSLTEGKK